MPYFPPPVKRIIKSANISWSYERMYSGTVFLTHCIHSFQTSTELPIFPNHLNANWLLNKVIYTDTHAKTCKNMHKQHIVCTNSARPEDCCYILVIRVCQLSVCELHNLGDRVFPVAAFTVCVDSAMWSALQLFRDCIILITIFWCNNNDNDSNTNSIIIRL